MGSHILIILSRAAENKTGPTWSNMLDVSVGVPTPKIDWASWSIVASLVLSESRPVFLFLGLSAS